jgi:hypothetical protein
MNAPSQPRRGRGKQQQNWPTRPTWRNDKESTISRRSAIESKEINDGYVPLPSRMTYNDGKSKQVTTVACHSYL